MNCHFPEGYSVYVNTSSSQSPPAPGVRQGERSLPGHHHRREDSLSSQVTHVFWEIVENVSQECCVYIVCADINAVVLFFCSYPYSEDYTKPTQYMNTRCPSWCDRILMSHSAQDIIYRVGVALSTELMNNVYRIDTKPHPHTEGHLNGRSCDRK